MPAVAIVAIRIEKNCLLIRAKRPLLHLAATGSQEFRGAAAIDGQTVKMLPAVLLACENNTIVGGPVNHTAAGIAGHVGKRVLQFPAAVPDFFCVPRRNIGNSDGPR